MAAYCMSAEMARGYGYCIPFTEPMDRTPPDDEHLPANGDDNKTPNEGGAIGRRKFIRIGGLSAAALATNCAKVAPETGPSGAPTSTQPAQPTAGAPSVSGQPAAPTAGQRPLRPVRATGPGFQRNFDPVPVTEPAMNFAAFTDTHVGQATRSPNWDFAKYLDKLGDDIMDNTLSSTLGS